MTDMEKAMAAVREKRLNKSQAAVAFNVSRRALGRHLKGPVGKRGAPTALPEDEEREIANCLEVLAEWGLALTPLCTRKIVQSYLGRLGRSSVFKDNLPGRDWARAFLKRHGLTLRRPHNLQLSRSSITREVSENTSRSTCTCN